MANQDFYNGGNTGQQFPQPGYSSYQQPQYNSGGQQGGSYGGQPVGTYGGQPVGTYGGQGQQYQAQYGTALRQDQSSPYPGNYAPQAQQPGYPPQQPMQTQPYTSAQGSTQGYDQNTAGVDGPQAGEGERSLGTHVVGAVGGRKVAKKMDLGPVGVLAAGFVGAKMLGNAKDRRDERRSSSRDNRQSDRYDDRYDDHHHSQSNRY